MRYLVEVCCPTIVPVTVEADNEQEARQQVMTQQGEAGDSYPGEAEIIAVHLLDG